MAVRESSTHRAIEPSAHRHVRTVRTLRSIHPKGKVGVQSIENTTMSTDRSEKDEEEWRRAVKISIVFLLIVVAAGIGLVLLEGMFLDFFG